MRGVNKVTLLGRLGKDPEVQYLDNGVSVAKFPMATSEVFKDKTGNRVEQTDWHNIVLWRGLAETAEKYLKKGSSLYLEGKIRSRSWDDKEGNKKYITEIIGDNFIMLDKKSDSEPGGYEASNEGRNTAPAQTTADAATNDGGDDLPF